MDPTVGGAIITDAIKNVQSQIDHLNTTEKKLLQVIKQNKDKEAEQQEEDIKSQKTYMMLYQIFIKSAT